MGVKKTIPITAAKSPNEVKKEPKGSHFNFDTLRPSWRISSYDKQGPWGLEYLLGPFVFSYSEDLLSLVLECLNDELNDCLTKLDGKEFSSISAFWDKVNRTVNTSLPIEVVSTINDCISRNKFMEKIYPKLVEFERITWTNIKEQSHMKNGRKVSNNHYIGFEHLSREAIDRLSALKLDDNDQIFSLRLEGTIRIYGFRKQSSLDIVWVDYDHKNAKQDHPIYVFD